MNRVELFTITSKMVMVAGLDEYRYHTADPRTTCVIRGTHDALVDETVETISAPIHRVCDYFNGSRSERLIAFEADIAKIFLIPDLATDEMKAQVARGGEGLFAAHKKIGNLTGEKANLLDQINGFNNKGYFKKVWLCIRGRKI